MILNTHSKCLESWIEGRQHRVCAVLGVGPCFKRNNNVQMSISLFWFVRLWAQLGNSYEFLLTSRLRILWVIWIWIHYTTLFWLYRIREIVLLILLITSCIVTMMLTTSEISFISILCNCLTWYCTINIFYDGSISMVICELGVLTSSFCKRITSKTSYTLKVNCGKCKRLSRRCRYILPRFYVRYCC